MDSETMDQKPDLNILASSSDLRTVVEVKVESAEFEESEMINCENASPEKVFVKAEPSDNSEDNIGSPSNNTETKPKDTAEENIPMKKPIVKPKRDPSNIIQRDPTVKKTCNKNLHSYNAIINIDVVSISEEERLAEHKAALEKNVNHQHKCYHCAKSFVSQKAYYTHMKQHKPKPDHHECDICHTYLKSPEMLYQHKLRHYRRYRCVICNDNKNYKEREAVACHIRTTHENGGFACEYCCKTFKSPTSLRAHVSIYHPEPLHLQCPECDQVFERQTLLRQHMRIHKVKVETKVGFKCKDCDYQGKSEASLARHMKTHKPWFKCYVCGNMYKLLSALAHHGRKKHPGHKWPAPKPKPEKRWFNCDVCGRRYTRQSSFTRHMRQIHPDTEYKHPEQKCEPCGRLFKNKAQLNYHNRRWHETKRFQCDYCKRFYLMKGDLRTHIKWKHMRDSNSGVVCHCGRQFRGRNDLRLHEQVHHASPQPLPCPTCPREFASEMLLKGHLRRHFSFKFPCDDSSCIQRFSSKEHADTHFKIRHGDLTPEQISAIQNEARSQERDKKCPKCFKMFTTVDAAKRHEKTHTMVEEYPCSKCNELFSSEYLARYHYLRKHHNMTHEGTQFDDQCLKEVEIVLENVDSDVQDPLA